MQLGLALQLVQAQAGVDQALEGLAQIGTASQVRLAPRLGQLALARAYQPGAVEQRYDLLFLFKCIAAQAFVTHLGIALAQEAIGLHQGVVGLRRQVIRPQCTADVPPQHGGVHAVERRKVLRAVQRHGSRAAASACAV